MEIKKLLLHLRAGKKANIWTLSKTKFDKRGGKNSNLIPGLGQIPGLA